MVELDARVGRVLETVRSLGISENTLVVYTSDNGPWLAYGIDGGSAGPLREGKGTSYEGGMRVPGISAARPSPASIAEMSDMRLVCSR